jgi:hypothetical protein
LDFFEPSRCIMVATMTFECYRDGEMRRSYPIPHNAKMTAVAVKLQEKAARKPIVYEALACVRLLFS